LAPLPREITYAVFRGTLQAVRSRREVRLSIGRLETRAVLTQLVQETLQTVLARAWTGSPDLP